MKKMNKWIAILLALAMIFAAGCGNGSNGTEPSTTAGTTPPATNKPTDPKPTGEQYTITFKDGDTVVHEASAYAGETVDLPADLTSDDPRMIFKGWEGVSEADINAGNVEVFADATYNAIWYEAFGTDQVFNANKLGVTDSITVDGVLDDAWQSAQVIPINTVTVGETDTNGTVRFLWDSQYIYIFAEVTDSTHYGWQEGAWIEHNDCFEVWIDLLHNDDSHGAAGYSGGWGGGYRGEPGPMCEAHFKINAGSEFSVDNRFNAGGGSEACWDGWLSNETNNDGVSYGTSKLTDTGYTVEYRIKTDHSNVPEELRPHANQLIGIGVKLYDKTADDSMSIVCMEAVNDGMGNGPKKLSNVKLVSDDAAAGVEARAKEVREGQDVAVDNAMDLIYKDAVNLVLGESNVKLLWKGDSVYAYAELGANTEHITFNAGGTSLKLDAGTAEGALKLGALSVDTTKTLTVTYKDGGSEVTADVYLKIENNESNIGRNTYEIEKLASGATITVDGDKDAAYGNAETVVIDTITSRENGGTPAATGKAWLRWDDEYLYAYVEVYDTTVSTEQKGDPWQNDSVELWISTCRTLPTSSTHWGDPNRPRNDYCGEGGFRVLANNVGAVTGQHWMYDWADGVPRETATKLTGTGYTVEYKIHFSTFAGEEKLGQVIDIMFNINDDNGDGAREGIVSTNTQGNMAYDLPYVLDHYKLVAAN